MVVTVGDVQVYPPLGRMTLPGPARHDPTRDILGSFLGSESSFNEAGCFAGGALTCDFTFVDLAGRYENRLPLLRALRNQAAG